MTPRRAEAKASKKPTRKSAGTGRSTIRGAVTAVHHRTIPDGDGGRMEADRVCIAGELRSGELNELVFERKDAVNLGVSLGDKVTITVEKVLG